MFSLSGHSDQKPFLEAQVRKKMANKLSSCIPLGYHRISLDRILNSGKCLILLYFTMPEVIERSPAKGGKEGTRSSPPL